MNKKSLAGPAVRCEAHIEVDVSERRDDGEDERGDALRGVGCESPGFKGFERGELTLTNMSLVFTYTQIKMFGKDTSLCSRVSCVVFQLFGSAAVFADDRRAFRTMQSRPATGKDIDHTFSWALRDIKVVNGKPQLIVDKGESHQCDVLLCKGKIELRMGSHADLSRSVRHARSP